jgi:putative ABC transport system permease protein
VVGDEVWRELFAGASLDEEPRLVADGVSWLVVGVLRRKPLIGSTDGTRIWDRKAIVPETTYDLLHAPEHGADRILLQPAGTGPVLPLELARRAVISALERRHHGAQNVELDDAAAREQERVILAIVQVLLIAIGALALLVGAINVANVMLVSVTERTKEIGLRRALGATRRSIAVQFLLESSVLALGGGIAGVAAGSALTTISGMLLSRAFGEFPAAVEPWAIGMGLALSLAAGIVAGVGPALRAASQNPIDALRTE